MINTAILNWKDLVAQVGFNEARVLSDQLRAKVRNNPAVGMHEIKMKFENKNESEFHFRLSNKKRGQPETHYYNFTKAIS